VSRGGPWASPFLLRQLVLAGARAKDQGNSARLATLARVLHVERWTVPFMAILETVIGGAIGAV
jgi:hypothetical protein